MVALRAHYATIHEGFGPTRFPGENGDYLEDVVAVIESGYYVSFGLVVPLPHWPPYWAQVWGDIVMRVQTSGTADVDLVTACAWFHDNDEWELQGWELKSEELIQSFEVTSTSWTTFQIPMREMMLGNPLQESDMSWNSDSVDYDSPDGYWYPTTTGAWVQQIYLPWVRVNAGPTIEVKMLRLWDQPTCATDG